MGPPLAQPPGKLANDEVRRIAREIAGAPGSMEQKQGKFGRQYPAFFEAYPSLFDMLCSSPASLPMLERMLDQMERVKAGEATQDAATADVHEALKAVYVDPLIPKE